MSDASYFVLLILHGAKEVSACLDDLAIRRKLDDGLRPEECVKHQPKLAR